MKKLLAIILCAVIVLSLASCSSQQSEPAASPTEAPTEAAARSDYVLSDDVKEGSVIDGVMTDISSKDPILKHTPASWLDTCVLYEVNIRQFTEEGTFKAFEAHLDRLWDMGVNTLWLMPIHPISETERKGTLGSYYAVSDYMDVNPEFGTMDDFRHLLDKAHGMGFKVILDWVANHTGRDNSWITEHDDWYVHNKSGDIESPYDWTDTAQLDYDNYEMRAEMIKCMQYWVEEIGVDGFRCDHAVGVPAAFWNAAVYQLKSVNSEIMMLAEASAAESLTHYAFDCCYNDSLYGQTVMVQSGISPSSVKDGMALTDRFAAGSFPMNYLDNHDKNSYEGSIVDRYGDSYAPLLALSYLTPGLPLVYTSDEMGYDHEIEFFEKDAVKWDEAPRYAALMTALASLKKENPALASTNADLNILDTDNSKIFAFSRTSGGNTVIYIANLYAEAVTGSVDADLSGTTCVLNGDPEKLDTSKAEITAEDFANKTFAPYEFYVLLK